MDNTVMRKTKITIDRDAILIVMHFVALEIQRCNAVVTYRNLLEEYVLVRLQKKLSGKLFSKQEQVVLSLERAELEALAKLKIWTPAKSKAITT